jgi:hypothetical protein
LTAKFLAAAEQVSVAAALGAAQDIVAPQAIDDEITVEGRAEDLQGDLVAAAGADGVDGDVLAAEDPQPGVDAADAPARLVGMHDACPPQRLDEQFVGRAGQCGEALLGADERGGANRQVAVGAEEVADLAVGDAEAVLEFGGHGQDDRAEGIARDAAGVGDLLRVPRLADLAAAGTPAGLDVELRDDRRDGRQVGLVLDYGLRVGERHPTLRAFPAWHVKYAIDLARQRDRAIGRRVPLGAAQPLGRDEVILGWRRIAGAGRLCRGRIVASERVGLALPLTFQFDEACSQGHDDLVANPAAGAVAGGKHGKQHGTTWQLCAEDGVSRGANPSCTPSYPARSRGAPAASPDVGKHVPPNPTEIAGSVSNLARTESR